MSDREKLIALVDDAIIAALDKCHAYEECGSCPSDGRGASCRSPFIADHLIANGVEINNVGFIWGDGYKQGYSDGCKVGFNIPVRCKDCKHNNPSRAIGDSNMWCDYWGTDPDPDDFCRRGERRSDD